jgi:CubicO group peptidase (beta-lactamase class C family)
VSRWLSAVLLTLMLAWALGASAGWRSAIDAAVRDAVAAGEVPGAVILVGQGDRILYRRAAGSRALVPAPEPMTVDTVFDLASLTKVVATTPAILALREAGRVDLDVPLLRYLPELDGTPYGPVTIRQVLTHSSGIPDPAWPDAASGDPPDARRLAGAAVAAAPPGTAFRYADSGFILLGELVRRVSGEPLDAFVSRRFFAPLGLAHTRFNPPPAWRPRIAPTEVVEGRPLRGVVHDPHARRLGGVAGHAGLFSSADDLARVCRMLLAGGRFGGRRYLELATVRAMFEPRGVGDAVRGLGWDMASPLSRTLGPYFPVGSLGHTGFTGTAVWLDPPSRSYLIILTSRLHPGGQGAVAELRRRVSAAVGAELFGRGAPPAVPALASPAGPDLPPAETQSGLDRLVAEEFALLRGRSVGLVTNQAGVDHRGRRGVDLLAAAPGVRLRALFAPEHGLGGDRDDLVPDGRDTATGLPVWSLYGRERRPSAAMLADLDTLVFDVQDVIRLEPGFHLCIVPVRGTDMNSDRSQRTCALCSKPIGTSASVSFAP